jgi:hypothetical protein
MQEFQGFVPYFAAERTAMAANSLAISRFLARRS